MPSLESLNNDMLKNGLPCNRDVELDGRYHRYCRNGSKIQDEWYIGSWVSDNHYWCTYGSWSQNQTFRFRSWEDDKELSPDTLKSYRERIDEANREWESKVKQTQEDINKIFISLSPTRKFKYLTDKQIDYNDFSDIKVYGIKNIVIPVYNLNFEEPSIVSIQYVFADGTKRFAAGVPSKGVYTFGNPNKTDKVFLCEGFATGYSIWKATGVATVVCFSAHNIPFVAKEMLSMGFSRVTHAQDRGEAGNRVREALNEFGVKSIEPDSDIIDGDFNGLHIEKGLDAVKKALSPKNATFNLKDLESMDIPKIKYFVDNLIREGSTNMIWAGTGCGKSSFCYSLGLAVSMGIPFLKWKCEKPRRVLYIDGEQIRSEFLENISPILKTVARTAHREGHIKNYDYDNFKMTTLDYVMDPEILGEGIDLTQASHRDFLDDQIGLNKSELIFLDNFSCLTFLKGDWNKREEDWKEIDKWMKKHVIEGRSFITVHHANKSNEMSGMEAMRRPLVVELELRRNNADVPGIDFNLIFRKGRMHPQHTTPIHVKYSDEASWKWGAV